MSNLPVHNDSRTVVVIYTSVYTWHLAECNLWDARSVFIVGNSAVEGFLVGHYQTINLFWEYLENWLVMSVSRIKV